MLYVAAGDRRARVPVDVRNQDVNGVNVVLSPGIILAGRVVIEGTDAPPNALSTLRITLVTDPVAGGFRSAAIANAYTPPVTPTADGTFTIGTSQGNAPTLLPGNYRVFVVPILNPAAGWADPPGFPAVQGLPSLKNAYVKSMRLGDRDVLMDNLTIGDQVRDRLVITVAMNGGKIQGRVVNEDKKPLGAATVVLIPEDNWRFQMNHKFASTDLDGRFDFSGIAPGDYQVFAWEAAEPGSWQNPDFVRDYESRGKAIHIDENKSYEMELKSIQ
jgi:hypothetical protein